jgi:DNA repair protein RadC
MKIREWRKEDRPRERLITQGAESLSDAELLAIFLRTGIPGTNVVELSQQLLKQFGSLRGLFKANLAEFISGPGLGTAKYVQLQAVLEMSRRYFAEKLQRGDSLNNPKDTALFLQSKLRDLPFEVFAMLSLDSQHRVVRYHQLFQGTIDSASVYPRVIAQQALEDNAAAMILAHNHPSGVAEPSNSDRLITGRIVSALALLDIKVLDHLVIGDGESISFAEKGLL